MAETSMEHEPDGAPARLTPYELVFAHPAFEGEQFPAIREEAETRGSDTASPEGFLLLGSVGRLLQELLPEEADGQALERYGLLLYHAYHFWRFGHALYLAEPSLVREQVERPPEVGAWELTPPAPAGYLQLPRHLFWARVEEAAPAEPVDGFFWTMVGTEDPRRPPYRRLDALLALGLRAGRPGFSTIPVGSELVAAPLGHWADVVARADGSDFANLLPGGEMQEWYTLATEAEVLKLVSLLFRHVAAHPDAVAAEAPAADEDVADEGAAAEALPPTRLEVRRIRPAGDDG